MNPRTRQAAKTFTSEQVVTTLQSVGIPFQVEGRQVNADLAGTGHHHIKITPRKGVYLDASTGKGGTIAALLRQIHAEVPTGESAPAQLANGGHDSGSTTSYAAQRIWGAGWTCTHAGDMPAGWDKDLNAAQKGARRTKLEQHRDIVRAYLTARLSSQHLDHWTRQVRIAHDGLMLTQMQKSGQIVGIQRTYFEDGQKSERKMLGTHGVQVLTPPAGIAPRDLGIGKAILLGEGWETTAAVVQASGWSGICGYDAGGVVKWAEQQAEQAKGMTPEQLAQAPAVMVLADRDQSQTGQTASARAVKILRAACLKAYYAIPPVPDHGGPKGGPKGSDWGDYPREGMSADVLAAHLALAVAHGDQDQEMPEVDDPGMVLSKPVQIRAWRPAKNPQTPALAGPTCEVRAGLQTALQHTVSAYLEWMKGDDKPFHPVLMMPTTGTGKSTAAKALTRNTGLRLESGRVCVFVPDHDQAGEYAAEGFFHFFGRTPDPDSPAYCPNHATAQEAMDKGHISQAEVCLQCSNGFAWQIDYYSDGDGQTTKAAPEKVAKAKSLLAARGLDWKTVTPCVWQSHLRDALEAQFTVAAAGSYSHSLTRDSLCIFDEHFEPGKGVNVTLQDIDHWIRRTQSIIEHLEKGDDADALGRHRQAGEFFRAMALAMAGWVGKTCAINIDTVLLESIKGILEAARQSSKSDIALAGWEKLQFNAAGEMSDNPLRAAHAIAESLKFGDGYVHDGQLVVAHSLPVMERLAGGQPTVIMDATPDPVIADVVQAQGGQIINAIAHQNVKISRHPTRFWGLTPLNVKRSGAERRDREIQKYESLMNHHDHDGAAFLFHKKAADAIDPEDENPMLGHWGRHHRAHNSWSGKPLVIVGSFFPPMEAWRAEYQRSRIAALSAGANPENWPVWPDDLQMIPDMWICEGDTDVQCRLPLPADDHIREWLLNRVTSETVQACGRARGANSETAIDIHIYGGVPLHGLWQHGLDIASYEADPECLGQTKAEHMEDMQEERETSLAKVDVLAARVISKGQTVTRAALESEAVTMAATGTDGPQSPVEYGLCQGGYNIHTTPAQRESAHTQAFTMPHERVVQEWFQTRAPLISQHLSTTGRNARTIKAAQEAALRFGEEMVKEALQMADLLFKSTGGDADRLAGIAWDTIEYGDASDAELVAARLVLVALGETEGVPPPW
ncbi:toprim domain-containing protein [Acidithiobacillus ferrianus]|uniref:Toprim domain-containing protein n=1 Tax=Acidithiobacillus ferrianus TaxID=2678518 RepID=A0ACD5H4A8_9PROT